MSNIPGVKAAPLTGISDQKSEVLTAHKQKRPIPKDSSNAVLKAQVKRSSAPKEKTILKETLDRNEVQALADELAQAIHIRGAEPRDVSLRYDNGNDVYVIEVKEPKSGELIIQFPPDEILTMRARLEELVGMLIDRKS